MVYNFVHNSHIPVFYSKMWRTNLYIYTNISNIYNVYKYISHRSKANNKLQTNTSARVPYQNMQGSITQASNTILVSFISSVFCST